MLELMWLTFQLTARNPNWFCRICLWPLSCYRIRTSGPTDRHTLIINTTITEWTHLSIVYRGTSDTLSLYINGKLTTPVTNTVDTSSLLPAETDTSGQFAIGKRGFLQFPNGWVCYVGRRLDRRTDISVVQFIQTDLLLKISRKNIICYFWAISLPINSFYLTFQIKSFLFESFIEFTEFGEKKNPK